MVLSRVKIRNWKSIVDLDLSLGKYTVIIGRSNKGKSAFIQAVRQVLLNSVGVQRIRKGATSAEIDLFFSDDERIHYKKSKSSSYLLINKNGSFSYEKMGRDVPPELSNIVRPWVVEGMNPIVVQVKDQIGLPFILGESSAAKQSSLLDNIEGKVFKQAVTACESNLRKLRRGKNREEEEVKKWSENLEAMESLLECVADLSEVRSKIRLVAFYRLQHYRFKLDVFKSGLNVVGGMLKGSLVKNLRDLNLECIGIASILNKANQAVEVEKITKLESYEREIKLELEKIDLLLYASGYCPLCGSEVRTGANA